jgi:tetratricopeptide (TPR) repeat protein
MQTISFYSYKGGVGRTLTLAHTAIQLAKNNIKVCVLDMDLEAPGILYKFQNKPDYSKEGMIDYIYDCVINNNVPNSIDKYFYTFQNENEVGYVKIMSAGKDMNKPEYFNKVSEISWDDLFFKKSDNSNVADGDDDVNEGLCLFVKLLELIETQIKPDYLFIDSRSGVTTMSKVCNSVLPDKVVMLLSNNEENINGSAIIYNHIHNSPYRLSKDNISVVCVLTRIPLPSSDADSNKEAEILQNLTQRFTNEKTNFLNDIVIIHSDREVEYMESTVLQFENSSNSNIYYEYYRLLTKIFDTELLLSRERLIKNKPKYSYIEYDLRKEISIELYDSLIVDDSNLYDTIESFTRENPTSYEALYKLGLVNAYFGKTFEAIDALSKAIRLNDQNDNIYYLRGKIFLYDLHNYNDAYSDLMRIYNKRSNRTAPFFCDLAVCMLCLNQYSDSLRYLTESISLDKAYYRPYLIRAICNRLKLDNSGKLCSLILKKPHIMGNILSDFDMAIRLKDDLANSYYCRGSFYYYLGVYDKEIEDYSKAIYNNQGNGVNNNTSGLVHDKKENYRLALEDYNKAIDIDPDYENAYFNRGILYYNKEEYDKSLVDLDKAFEINKDQTFLFYYYRGKTYLYLNQYDNAILDFNKAIELDPKSCWGYCNRAKSYAKLGRNPEAISDFNKALDIELNCEDAYNERASILENTSDTEKVEQDRIKNEELAHKESLKKEDIEGTVVDTYKFPVKYTNGKYFEFTLRETKDGFILTDLGNTYKALKQRHELKVPFMQHNISIVLEEFDVKEYENEFVIKIQPLNIKTEDNNKINEVKYTMFRCVSFLNKLRLFYINDSDNIEASNYKFVHLQNKDDVINKFQNRIDTYTFYTSYYKSLEEIEFLLVEREGKTLITDQGKTYDMLDDIFKLSEDDVKKNLTAIMTDCQVLQNGKEFIIPINTFYNNPHSKENEEIMSAKYRLFECVSFMNTMYIFYK